MRRIDVLNFFLSSTFINSNRRSRTTKNLLTETSKTCYMMTRALRENVLLHLSSSSSSFSSCFSSSAKSISNVRSIEVNVVLSLRLRRLPKIPTFLKYTKERRQIAPQFVRSITVDRTREMRGAVPRGTIIEPSRENLTRG